MIKTTSDIAIYDIWQGWRIFLIAPAKNFRKIIYQDCNVQELSTLKYNLIKINFYRIFIKMFFTYPKFVVNLQILIEKFILKQNL